VTGESLAAADYEKHVADVLPNAEEKKFVAALMKEPGWIAERDAVASVS